MSPFFPRWIRRFFRDEKHWEDLNFFRSVTLFFGMSSRQLGRLMQAMQKRTYQSGEQLFTQGQVGRAVFVIKSGQVELSRHHNGHKQRLGILGPGQIFGEMALLENMPRTANAVVVEDGEIYLLYTATLESLINHYPDMGIRLMKNMAIMLSALLRRTNKQLTERLTIQKKKKKAA